jgi:hypothetical protein
MRSIAPTLALLMIPTIFGVAYAAASGVGRPRILVEDPGTEEDISGPWWGLCEKGGKVNLIPVKAIRQSTTITVGETQVDRPPIRIVGCKSPIVALRDMPFLTERSVVSSHIRQDQFVDKDRYATDFAGEHVVVESRRIEEWGCVLQVGTRVQILSSDGEDGPGMCRLIWAGDIDRDGRLDIVVDIYRGKTPLRSLMVSSGASSGEILHSIASTIVDPS